MHNVGHFRYLECSHRTEEGKPTGDIAVWDEIRFPFDPSLAGTTQLDGLGVQHTATVETQSIRERYLCGPSGAVEVEISNVTAGYTRRYRLGRWAGKDAAVVVPGRRKKSKAEDR
jgi:hypothetical protein